LGGFLVGKQIGTSIFRFVDVKTYDSSNENHKEIVQISKNAHLARAAFSNTDDLDVNTQKRLDNLVERTFL
jgi:hypothetical protein